MSNLELKATIMETDDRPLAVSMAESAGARTLLGALPLCVLSAMVVFSCLILSACGGKGSSVTTVTSITITASAASTPVNGQITFTAVVKLSDSSTSTTTTVSWEVDGVAGGNPGCGSIAPFSTDQLQATYEAPGTVPTSSCGSTTQLGQVAVTAVATQTGTSGSSNNGSVTSNTVIVTVGSGLGLSVTPPSANVPAGGTAQFTALLNGVPTAAAWTLSSTSGGGGGLGTVDGTGLYSAPPFPPPGASVTITATVTESDGTVVKATSTALIAYSDHSLSGPYAFSYAGNDAAGFLAVAGSLVADGNGKIISGVEDLQSALTGTSTALLINGNSSTYSIGGDGRGIASVVTSRGTQTWSFVLSTNQHGELIRFDTDTSGGGSIDQQSLNALTNSVSAISGRYAFSLLGLDAGFNPLGLAGELPTGGVVGSAVLDVNDNGIAGGTVTKAGAVLSEGFAVDTTHPGTGRGTFTLQGAAICTVWPGCTFAYYAVGTTTNSSDAIVVSQLHLVEIDGIQLLAGDMYLAAATPGLSNATYVFKAGGNSSAGAFASGGVFESDGASTTSNGVLDINNAGTYNSGPSLGSCSFASDASTGRIDLKLFVGSGACPGSSPSISEFAAYPTALGSVVMLELDSSAVAAGLGFQQCGPQSAGCAALSPSLTAASLAAGLDGQGLFHSPPASSTSFQPDLDGEINVSGLDTSGGKLDINNFGAVFHGDPLGTTGNSLGSPASNGRGTATLTPTNPAATYNLVYYLIDDDTALLFSSSQSPVAIGTVLRQF
jgi:hypothetical protein